MNCHLKHFEDQIRSFPASEPDTYIAFFIDPVATVENLNDREPALGCQLMENKKHVALVIKKFSKSLACLHLLFPKKVLTHSVGSLSVLPFLPWPNCHHSGFASLEARSRTACTNALAPWHYDIDHLSLYHEMLTVDVHRLRAARDAHVDGLPSLPPPPQHVIRYCEEPWWGKLEEPSQMLIWISLGKFTISANFLDSKALNFSRKYIADSEDFDSGPDLFDLPLELLGCMFMKQSSSDAPLPIINVSYYLREVAEVNDLQDFFKELEVLNQYGHQFAPLYPDPNVLRSLQEMSKARAIKRACLSDEKQFGKHEETQPGSKIEAKTTASLLSLGTVVAKTRRHVGKIFCGIKRRGKSMLKLGRIFGTLNYFFCTPYHWNGNWETMLQLEVPHEDADGGSRSESVYAPYMDVFQNVVGPKDAYAALGELYEIWYLFLSMGESSLIYNLAWYIRDARI
ncbi:hypothetical protein B0H10DRAFT_1951305 [Mycena sp. CBHHK59/15]|nr:hypothetical protein B0H10DRAFT_1951305 [Mycena sp. CBHHK59/15]